MRELTTMSFVDPDRTGKVRSVDGPWRAEPDKAHWVDEASDLDCLTVRNRMGTWCGYVGLPCEHPLFGKGWDEVESTVDLRVHGGLTFANFCSPGENPTLICHVPLPGRPERVWWLGFDCGHAFDLSPSMLVLERELPQLAEIRQRRPDSLTEVYRDFDYVTRETTGLARQLARV